MQPILAITYFLMLKEKYPFIKQLLLFLTKKVAHPESFRDKTAESYPGARPEPGSRIFGIIPSRQRHIEFSFKNKIPESFGDLEKKGL